VPAHARGCGTFFNETVYWIFEAAQNVIILPQTHNLLTIKISLKFRPQLLNCPAYTKKTNKSAVSITYPTALSEENSLNIFVIYFFHSVANAHVAL